jgi:hypothetical protein
VVAQKYLLGITTLGDSSSFQRSLLPSTGGPGFRVIESNLNEPSYLLNTRRVATDFTELLGGVFNLVLGGNVLLINFAFQSIAFVGIVVFLRATPVPIRVWLALLLMLPSFTIWSSIASKEAIVVLGMGVVGAYIIRLYDGTARLHIGVALSFVLIAAFKPQYLPAIVFIIFGTFVGKYVTQKVFFLVVVGLLSLVPLYLFRDTIDAMALDMPRHFSSFSSTAAENVSATRAAYWTEQYDVYRKAPYGMFQSFFGPTLGETSRGVLLAASFAESLFLMFVLLVYSIKQFFRLPVFMVVMSAFTLFWVLFTAYPTGMMNPGTALRYRTGYEMLVFLAIVVLLSRETYVGWRGVANAKVKKEGPRGLGAGDLS